MTVDLDGKVALVTGAGEGIGRAIALALAANGASVVVNDVSDCGEQTAKAVRALGRPCRFLAADISKPDEVRRMIATAEAEFSTIDILVNNAGVNTPGSRRRSIYEFDEDEWRRILSVDLDGLFHCCRAACPGMVARKTGVIVNIASVVGMVPLRLQSAFAAAKAAAIQFTRAIALELGPFGIRVNAIAPGSILTRATEALFYNPEHRALSDSLLSHIPLHRPGTPEEVAGVALFLASPDAAYITGTVVAVDGGWTAGYTRDW